MKKSNKNYKWMFLIVLPVIAVIILINSRSKDTHTKPQYKELTEAVYASGNILPQNEYKVFAMAEGFLIKKLVVEGDSVKANQPLFVIENTQQNIRVNNANETYNMALRNYGANSPILKEMEVGIATAYTQYQNDSVNLKRFENLWKENATSKIEYDKAKLLYETSRNNYQMQKARYEKTKNDLLLSLQNAKSQYQLNSEQNTDYIIRSKIDGVVYEIYKEEGEVIRRNEAVALVGAKDNVYINLTVDEQDIDKIKTGQEILVKVDVYKDKIFKGKVTKIYKMLDKQSQSFRVDAEFTDEYPSSFSGLTVEANIIISHKEKALVVPKSLVISDDSLLIQKNGKEQKIKIRKGIETYDWVEVLSELDTSTILITK